MDVMSGIYVLTFNEKPEQLHAFVENVIESKDILLQVLKKFTTLGQERLQSGKIEVQPKLAREVQSALAKLESEALPHKIIEAVKLFLLSVLNKMVL